jgi:uncharacterized protein YggE
MNGQTAFYGLAVAMVAILVSATLNGSPVQAYEHDDVGTTIAVTGTASLVVQPDTAIVRVEAQSTADTSANATKANTAQVVAIVNALERLNATIPISTEGPYVYPVYQPDDTYCIAIYPTPPECLYERQAISGFTSLTYIVAELPADEGRGPSEAIESATSAGATGIQGVQFGLSDTLRESLSANLTTDAISDARQRAEVAADALGVEIAGVKSAEIGGGAYHYFADAAVKEGGPLVLPGEQTVTTTVNVVYRAI